MDCAVPTLLSKTQMARCMRNDYIWWIRKLLDTMYNEQQTLTDIGLTQTTAEKVQQTVLNIWCGEAVTGADMTAQPTMPPISGKGESSTPNGKSDI